LHSHVAPLPLLTVALTAGIVAGQWLHHWAGGLAVLAVLLVVSLLLRRQPRLQTAAIVACFVLLGEVLRSRTTNQLEVEWPDELRQLSVVVASEPVVKEKVVAMDVLTVTGHQKLKCRIVRDSDSERITIGDGLVLQSRVTPVHEWHNGHFDYRLYLQSHGFTGETLVKSGCWQWQQLPLDGLSLTARIRLRFLLFRHQLLQQYRQWGITHEAYGVIAAMTLGERSQLDVSLKETYSRVGVSHILALSGLHLMIIYTLITLLLGRRRLRLTTQVLTVLAVWAFALLVGLSPSVTRAAFMITVYALLSLGYRERMSVNTLAFVAMVMLMFNPYALFDIGFQLSFAAVLSILLFHPLLVKFIPSHLLQRHRWLNMLWSMTIVSVSAQIGTAPLVAYTFGRFATTFLLANYIVIPLATLVLYLTLACVLTWWWSAVQWWIAKGLSVIVLLMNRLLEYMASWSFSSIEAVQLSATQVVLLYVLIGCLYYFIRLGQTTHSVSWNKLVEKDSDK